VKASDVGLLPGEKPRRLHKLIWAMLLERRAVLRRMLRSAESHLASCERMHAQAPPLLSEAHGPKQQAWRRQRVTSAKRARTRVFNKLAEHEQRMREWCFMLGLARLPANLQVQKVSR